MLDVLVVPTLLVVSPLLGLMVMARRKSEEVDPLVEADRQAILQVLERECVARSFPMSGIELYCLAGIESAMQFAQIMRELSDKGVVLSTNGKCDLSDYFVLAAHSEEAIA